MMIMLSGKAGRHVNIADGALIDVWCAIFSLMRRSAENGWKTDEKSPAGYV
jgi:hypothetical protein